MRVKTLIFYLLLCFCGGATGLAAAAEREPVSDLRILIDISGSMKKNDPNNLRVPALRLITELLPEGSRSGVWTFGQYVNMLVPRAEVSKIWKESAYVAAGEINSKGMFTNIEAVLEDATWDWKEPDVNASRSLIFLTDGLVDVSKDEAKNRDSKQKILRDTLNRLKEAGVTIHTIALSKQADREFLRQLSASTKGWYEEVETAAQLERVFLKMFEKTVQVESLPMTNNSILVDESISELTLLMFRKEGAKALSITMSDGEKIDYRKKPDNVRWRHEERYDLVTIDKPVAGEWTIEADLDPDNRVMVVADLKISASRLPNTMLSADAEPYYLELLQQGEIIRKPEFLDLLNVSLSRFRGTEQQHSIILNDNGEGADKRAHDGRFSARLDDKPEPGQYDYQMLVDGATFKRIKRYSVKVVDQPVAVSMRKVAPGNYSLTLTPYSELIKTDSLLVDATVIKDAGASEGINIPRTGPNEWRLDVSVEDGKHYDVKIVVQADRSDGRSAEFDLGQFRLDGNIAEHSVEVEADVKPQAPTQTDESDSHGDDMMAENTSIDEEANDDIGDHEPVVAADEGIETSSWIWTTLKVLGFNGVLVLIGFFVYRKWFRGPVVKKDDEEANEVGDDAPADKAKEKG